MMASLAAFRPNRTRDDLNKLAEEHLKHDLTPEDRDALKSAAGTVSTWTVAGSTLGLGLGLLLAFRVRRARTAMFNAFRATEQPTTLMWASGRTEQIPDVTALARPSALGDFAAYFFFGLGALFLGGETGLLTGGWLASNRIQKDEARKARIEKALRSFRVDYLRRQADVLEKGQGGILDQM